MAVTLHRIDDPLRAKRRQEALGRSLVPSTSFRIHRITGKAPMKTSIRDEVKKPLPSIVPDDAPTVKVHGIKLTPHELQAAMRQATRKGLLDTNSPRRQRAAALIKSFQHDEFMRISVETFEKSARMTPPFVYKWMFNPVVVKIVTSLKEGLSIVFDSFTMIGHKLGILMKTIFATIGGVFQYLLRLLFGVLIGALILGVSTMKWYMPSVMMIIMVTVPAFSILIWYMLAVALGHIFSMAEIYAKVRKDISRYVTEEEPEYQSELFRGNGKKSHAALAADKVKIKQAVQTQILPAFQKITKRIAIFVRSSPKFTKILHRTAAAIANEPSAKAKGKKIP